MRILLVESETSLAYVTRRALTQDGHEVTHAHDGASAVRACVHRPHDLLIVDRLLPDCDGLDLCRRLREKGLKLPILMLVDDPMAFTQNPDPERAADDYLAKPFAMRELLAKVDALLRRRGLPPRQPSRLELGDLAVDLTRREAWRGDRTLELTDEECAILQCLASSPGRVRTLTEITDHVWSYESRSVGGTVDDSVRALSRKIETGAGRQLIRRVGGAGYKIEA